LVTSVLLNVFEQTSSASRSVSWAGVPRPGPHFEQHDSYAALGELPGGLGTGEAATHNVYRTGVR
jgi:hypothetical protein